AFPGDLIGWAVRGPGDSRYAGRPLDFNNFDARGLAYNKVSLNYARDITPKLKLGARFNYMLGVGVGETTKLDGTLTLGIDSVNINSKQILVQEAGYDFFNKPNLGVSDYVNYLLKTKNKGIAWDFGATYQMTERLTCSTKIPGNSLVLCFQ